MENYTIIDVIGKGAQGTVYLAKSKKEDDGLVAVKKLESSVTNKMDRELFTTEINSLISLKDDNLCNLNVVCYYDNFIDNNNNVYLVMEYVDGNLMEYVNKYEGKKKQEEVILLLQKILSGLFHIHNKNIVHGDIKPDNIRIRLSDKEPVLIDLGLSCTKSTQLSSSNNIRKCKDISGTIMYCSPELINYKKPNYANDIWSLGITILVLLGINPYPKFGKLSIKEFHNKISCYDKYLRLKPNIDIQYYNKNSDFLKNIVKDMLVFNYDDRMDSFELLSKTTKYITENIFKGYDINNNKVYDVTSLNDEGNTQY